jgi:hypothetical protein
MELWQRKEGRGRYDKGKIVGQKKLPNNGEIAEFLKEFDETMEVAIQASPSWYWLFVHPRYVTCQ